MHRPKLQANEGLGTIADPLLAEKHGAGRAKLDHERYQSHERKPHRGRYQNAGQVKRALPPGNLPGKARFLVGFQMHVRTVDQSNPESERFHRALSHNHVRDMKWPRRLSPQQTPHALARGIPAKPESDPVRLTRRSSQSCAAIKIGVQQSVSNFWNCRNSPFQAGNPSGPKLNFNRPQPVAWTTSIP